jgi:hypothetical protein
MSTIHSKTVNEEEKKNIGTGRWLNYGWQQSSVSEKKQEDIQGTNISWLQQWAMKGEKDALTDAYVENGATGASNRKMAKSPSGV